MEVMIGCGAWRREKNMKKLRKMTAICLVLILLMTCLSACTGSDADSREVRKEGDKKPTATPTVTPDGKKSDGKIPRDDQLTTPTPGQEKKTIVMWCNATKSDATRHAYEAAARDIKKMYPDVEFEWEAFEYDSYKMKLRAAVAGDALPDIFYVWDTPNLQEFVLDGRVYCLDSAYAKFASDLPGRMCQNFTIDGHLYAIPTNFDLALLFANMEMLKQVGYTEIPGTYEDLMACCDKLVAAGYVPFACSGREEWCLSEYLESMIIKTIGAETLDRIFCGKETWNNQDIANTADMLQAMFQKGYFDRNILNYTNVDAKEGFLDGRFAFYLNGTWNCADMSLAQFDVAMGEFPVIDPSRAMLGMLIGGPSVSLAVSKNTSDCEFTAEYAMKFAQLVAKYSYLDGAGLPAWDIDYDDSIINALYRKAAVMAQEANGMVVFGDTRMNIDSVTYYLEALSHLLLEMVNGTGFIAELTKNIR